jgi:hypothetical protein
MNGNSSRVARLDADLQLALLCLSPGGRLRGPSVGEGFERVGYGGEHQEQRFGFGDLEHFHDALVDAGERHAASGLLARDAGTDQRAQTRGIEIRHAREVEDHGGRVFAAHRIDEGRNIFDCERAVQAEDSPVNTLDL